MGIFKLNKYLNLLIAFIIIIISNILIDHFFAPKGIELTPLVIIASALIINLNKEKFHTLLQSIFTFSLIALNDIGIKLYGGGMHDPEGLGFINLFLIAGLIPCFIILVISTVKNKNSSIPVKIGTVLLFLLLIFLHLNFLGNLGLGRYYPIKY